MISKMKLTNYKCFFDSQLEFLNLTILAGANAAGKSSVIQALLLANNSSKKMEGTLDVTKALDIQVGNPQSLVAHNPVELNNADFKIELMDDEYESTINYRIDKFAPLKLFYEKDGVDLIGNLVYINAERVGPRISYPAGGEDKFQSDGSNAAYLIDRADMEKRKIHKSLALNGEASKFSIHVEQWMNTILGDVSFNLNTDLVKAATDIRYSNSIVNHDVLPTMTGFGISYILSIITAGLWCSSLEKSMLIIENPEAHLHPYSQSQMGKFLMLLANAGVQVVVETHSEHIIDGARIQAAFIKRTQDICVNFLEAKDNKINVKKILVSETGELSEWPNGFFDQKTQDLRELFMMRRKNAN